MTTDDEQELEEEEEYDYIKDAEELKPLKNKTEKATFEYYKAVHAKYIQPKYKLYKLCIELEESDVSIYNHFKELGLPLKYPKISEGTKLGMNTLKSFKGLEGTLEETNPNEDWMDYGDPSNAAEAFDSPTQRYDYLIDKLGSIEYVTGYKIMNLSDTDKTKFLKKLREMYEYIGRLLEALEK